MNICKGITDKSLYNTYTSVSSCSKHRYEGESIKNLPNLFLGEIDLFFFNVIAL